jgi:hypothetical protein
VGARRASWRVLSAIESKEKEKGDESKVSAIGAYRVKVEQELAKICQELLTPEGWVQSCTMEAVILQVAAAITKAGARVVASVSADFTEAEARLICKAVNAYTEASHD